MKSAFRPQFSKLSSCSRSGNAKALASQASLDSKRLFSSSKFNVRSWVVVFNHIMLLVSHTLLPFFRESQSLPPRRLWLPLCLTKRCFTSA